MMNNCGVKPLVSHRNSSFFISEATSFFIAKAFAFARRPATFSQRKIYRVFAENISHSPKGEYIALGSNISPLPKGKYTATKPAKKQKRDTTERHAVFVGTGVLDCP